MKRINYKSDFDFILHLKDCKDPEKAVPFPECGFDIRFWASNKANAYIASYKDGVYTNCFRTEDGGMHFVFDNHRLGVGTLKWEPHFELPNDIYPDNIQDMFSKEPLDIELVDGPGDCPTTAEIEIMIPFVYISAYDLAVRNGYKGTLEEYIEYADRFPEVVETSDMIRRLLSDLDEGKARIADALTRQGEPTERDEPMSGMAEKVLGLRLAVPGQPGIVDQTFDGRLPYTDLLNLLRNSLRADYPYCYGVRHALNSVMLMGAGAYLCSDGFFTEAGGVHEFSGTGDRWIIYYFRDADYMVTAPTPCMEIVALNGRPQFNLESVTAGSVRSYTEEKYTLEAASGYAFGSITDIAVSGVTSAKRPFVNVRPSLLSLLFPDLEECSVITVYNCNSMKTISFPSLKKVTGGTGTVYTCSAMTEVNAPALEEITGGSLTTTLSALTRLEFPALRKISGGTATNNCAALTDLSLPALEEITGGTAITSCHALAEIDFPALRNVSQGALILNANALVRIGMPVLESIEAKNTQTMIGNCPELEEVEFTALRTCTIWTTQINLFDICPKLSRISFPALDFIGGGGRKFMMIVNNAAAPHLVIDVPVCRSFSGSCYGADGHVVEIRFGAAIQNIRVYLSVKSTLLRLSVPEGAVTSIDTNWGGAYPLVWDEESLHETLRRLGDNTGGDTLAIKIGADMIALLSDEEIASLTARNYTLS